MKNNTNPADQQRAQLRSLDPESAQRELLLRRIVRPNEACEFGKAHRFSAVQSVHDFQRAVKVCGYEGFRRDVRRMMRGEAGVLTSEPVRRFLITRGSTARPKYIPLTSSLVRDKWRAFQTYWSLVRGDHPEVGGGQMIANFFEACHEHTSRGGALCTSESYFWNSFSAGDRTAQYPLPPEILKISDPEARRYTITRILLETEVSVLMCLTPGTMVQFFEILERYPDLLEEDVKRGGLSAAMAVEPEVRQYILARYQGNPARAQELRAAWASKQAAAHLWPNLALAVCWHSPVLQPYLALLGKSLGTLPQRDYITMATEGVIAIPSEDSLSGGVLAVDTHFYEFIPEELAELDDPPTLLAHEIEPGRKYAVVLSTSGGLYRYKLGDVVQVRDFMGATPVVEFLHRNGHTCSLAGEMLTEDQVASAVHQASSRANLPLRAFTLYPVFKAFPHYGLLAELETIPERDYLVRFVTEMEHGLCTRNAEYQAKRLSRRLGAPEFWLVPQGSYAALQQRKAEATGAQALLPCLTRDPRWREQFEIAEPISCELAA
jgi:GH3 auxin-responsive promoter